VELEKELAVGGRCYKLKGWQILPLSTCTTNSSGSEAKMLSSVSVGLLAVALQVGTPWSQVDRSVAMDSVVAVTGGAMAATGGGSGLSDDRELHERAIRALAGVPFAIGLSESDHVWVERTLESMTLREKVAQLVVPYIEGGRPASGSASWRRAQRLVTEEKVGGFIVGVGASYETASWLNELQRLTAVPLLMTADLEWGPGTRLRGATVLPINMAIAAAGSPELAFEAGRITALEARAAGLHVAYAPVADVNVNPLNPVINTRAYGSDAEVVSARVVSFIEGARSGGLLTVAKHFPGHGDTETDSHLALPVLSVDRFRLDEVELPPFRAAINAGVGGVMTAHMAVPALDPDGRLRPATLSPPILTGLLRGELAFAGLVVTDALHMDGVKGQGRAGDVAVAAVRAGADILLIPPDAAEVIDAVTRAVLSGVVSEARIEQSARLVLAAKAAVGLNTGAQVDLVGVRRRLGQAQHVAWAEEVSERSITLVRGGPGVLPLAIRGRSILAVAYDDRAGHRRGARFEEVLTGEGARVQTVRLSRQSTAAELARVRRLAAAADLTVFSSYARAIPWKGALGLPENVAALARHLAAGGAPVISFGDPYLLRQVPDAATYMLAWSEVDASQRAAARALIGLNPVTGRLPIDLPPYYRVGHGMMLPEMVPALPGVPAVQIP
jgi:beta-N-acetylhexosaminidase